MAKILTESARGVSPLSPAWRGIHGGVGYPYPLVMTNSLLLKMVIEIDLAIENGDFPVRQDCSLIIILGLNALNFHFGIPAF